MGLVGEAIAAAGAGATPGPGPRPADTVAVVVPGPNTPNPWVATMETLKSTAATAAAEIVLMDPAITRALIRSLMSEVSSAERGFRLEPGGRKSSPGAQGSPPLRPISTA